MAGLRAIPAIFALLGLFLVVTVPSARAEPASCSQPLDICEGVTAGAFALVSDGIPVRVMTDDADWPGVLRAAGNLTTDLSALARGEAASDGPAILAGTLGRSPLIDALVAEGKLDVSAIEGVWEGYVQAVVEAPMEGVPRALVIAGADKRGTIYGIYDLAERAGVSPWAWWADVPVPHRPDLSVLTGTRADWPRVKYRGIFINDEKPALHGWVNHYYGGFKSGFYERVFELILRNKGNYLWPAMWGESIYDDDPLTGPLADEMGVVVGMSHHEPMGRAHVEWARYGEGKWDYTVNAKVLRDFWRAGMERMKDWETIVTLGMRGDGDEAMTEGTAIALLEQIVSDQRDLIEEVTDRPASEQPSIWALYKEVQDYYDQGMQVPDDITLLFADDNWGNIRRLPKPGSERPGGYGVYYHFDYVGGPRNYKWLNTNQIERVWEQMNLAWETGARQIWIVNVGDIKPMEFPISFFLDQAWNPEAMSLETMTGYTDEWAAAQFPADQAAEIADILTLYAQISARRKPELTDADTYSALNFRELERVTGEWRRLAMRTDAVRAALPPEYDDAFVQLVWFPVQALGNLHDLYEAVALNWLYAAQGRATDALAKADEAKAYFARDAELTRIYHEDVADGKWIHMMSQTHIGYTYWQQPDKQVMPELVRPEVPLKAGLGVSIESDPRGWRAGDEGATLLQMDVFARKMRWIELYNTGPGSIDVSLSTSDDWILLPDTQRSVDGTQRIDVGVDWDKVPDGRHTGEVLLTGPDGRELNIAVPVFKPEGWKSVTGFPLAEGFAAIQVTDASRKRDGQGAEWKVIPNLGPTGDGLTLVPAVSGALATGRPDSPRLEFDVHLFEDGALNVRVALAPTLDFKGQGGLKFAVSVDDGEPQVVNLHTQLSVSNWSEAEWEKLVARNAHQVEVALSVENEGPHTIKIWAIDTPLVFQTVTVSQKPVPGSYLGPPATRPRQSN